MIYNGKKIIRIYYNHHAIRSAIGCDEANLFSAETCVKFNYWKTSGDTDIQSITDIAGPITSGDTYAYNMHCKTDLEYYIQLKTVSFKSCTTEIGDGAFRCQGYLNNVLNWGSIERIGKSAFLGSGLEKLTFTSPLRIVDDSAFASCSLSAVTLPLTIEYIGVCAFCSINKSKGCTFTFLGETPPVIQVGSFPDISENYTIKVPSSSVDAYKTASEVWKTYANKIESF